VVWRRHRYILNVVWSGGGTDTYLMWCGLEEAQIHTYSPVGVGERIFLKIGLIYWFATINFQERPLSLWLVSGNVHPWREKE